MNAMSRNGNQARFSGSRYFFIANQGWYLEAREGIQGPFPNRGDAEAKLAQLKEASPIGRTEIWQLPAPVPAGP